MTTYGWTVPGYAHVRELGAGGGGRVVLAVHGATGTPVAVKYLSERLREDPAFLAEFRAEARLLGRLDSPYVVRLYEYVEAPGGAAIAMELVDGISLRAVLRESGQTGPEAALVVLKGSLLGLAAAHRTGVVHRDYKPENVLVAADGSSKLVDFGIAARRGTTPGVAGTPAYMAPEQWQGRPASPAADVYAATATFFECLTGHKPFPGQNFAELAVQHVEAPVPEDEAPETVRPLIRRGMAKSPEQRPGDAEEFVAELEHLALAAYGPDWEERGQRRLAAAAALLPLLFPSSGGTASGTTAVATTSLGRGSGWAPGRRGSIAAGAALVLGVVIGAAYSAVGGEPGAARAADSFATSRPVTPGPGPGSPGPGPSVSPSGSTPASPSPSASGSPSPSPWPSLSARPSPSRSAVVRPSASASPARPPSPRPSPTATPTPKPTPVVHAVGVQLAQTGPDTAAADISFKTTGTGPVRVTVQWFTGDDGDAFAEPDGTTVYEHTAGGGTAALAAAGPVTHTFKGGGCHWGVRVTTSPAAGQGPATDSLVVRRCSPA
ncbi:Serine_threonine-protein kinase PknD [Streptomyces sp. enrichment culture]|uniref:serine/threonine-protein kinase n=1 Tax=Streptomyces sp. enrichment culture TaxID=1795815 RepID=UPI003F570E1A